MTNNQINSANCSVFDAVFAPHTHPEISDNLRSIIHTALNATDIDEATLAAVTTLLDKGAAAPERPMTVAEAVKLTGISAQGLSYHARRGRIRRAYIPGSTRAIGYVRSDIMGIINGTNVPDITATDKAHALAAKAATARWQGKEAK